MHVLVAPRMAAVEERKVQGAWSQLALSTHEIALESSGVEWGSEPTLHLDSHTHPTSTSFLTIIMSGAAAAGGASKFASFMNHPAGPKTVFFWAPLMKWCLVAAGLKDLTRPADKLSVSQNLALAGTGFIWVRYSFVITPVNYSLAAVNFFVGLSGLSQLGRIAHFRMTHAEEAKKL
ncbi:putative mediates the uptake of pyruvate into mitochondria [Lyophyllum shimeji]|uniref:Mitochondrial pyruvate carrier n=1 Tax=Lyophyllum shimeji TaxID=47721 RepID=A0A9P3PJC2_LYOSH|nr:putative mediates the uptake of pyruvate into mitochondria [Lyophyllum shimeji]